MYLFEECGRAASEAAAASETQEVLQGLATIICEGYKEQLAAIPIRASIDWSTIQDRFVGARRKVWGLLGSHTLALYLRLLTPAYQSNMGLLLMRSNSRKSMETSGL